MIRRLVFAPLPWILMAGVAVFASAAGFQLGGGTVPGVPALSNELLYVAAAGLLGIGVFGTLLRRPDIIGRWAPTLYVLAGLLPLLRFPVPGAFFLRFVPLALMAPVVYAMYRDSEPVPSHTRVARTAMFAAFATAASSLIAHRADTDYMRLLLMVTGIVLIVGAAPRVWAGTWRASVEKAVTIAFWAIVVSSVVLLPFSDSFQSDRLRGAFTSPNTLGALLALTTPLAASRARFPIVYWSIAYALAIASGSRGGMLALSLAAVVILLKRRRGFQLVLLVLIGVIVLSSGVVRTQANYEESLGINTRELVWADIYGAFQESPLTGYGFGTVTDHVYSTEVERFVGNNPQTHSSWLDVLYEQGLLGIVPWIVALLVGLVAASRAGPVWIATVLAGLLSATFESWMFAIGSGIASLYWLLLGAAALGTQTTRIERSSEQDSHHEPVDEPVQPSPVKVDRTPQPAHVFRSELPTGPNRAPDE